MHFISLKHFEQGKKKIQQEKRFNQTYLKFIAEICSCFEYYKFGWSNFILLNKFSIEK